MSAEQPSGREEWRAAVEDFWAARQPGGVYPGWWQGRLSIEDGYRVQLALLDRHAARGERQAGWKVGLTARAIREQFGFVEPAFACLLDSGRWPSGGTWPLASLVRPGWEHELCLLVGTRLAGPGVTAEDVRAAIQTVMPALEIVEARGPNSPEALPAGLADNGQQRAFVVGAAVPFHPAAHDLGATRLEVWVDGERTEIAHGRAVMESSPLASVAWLANRLAAFGRAIEPGQVVMSGSFTRQYALDRPLRVEARFVPFGSVTATFA